MSLTKQEYDDEHDLSVQIDDTCPVCHGVEEHADDCEWKCIRCSGTKDDVLNEYCEACHEEGYGR